MISLISEKIYGNLRIIIISVCFALSVTGFLFLISAVDVQGNHISILVQLFSFFLGFLALFLFSNFDYRRYSRNILLTSIILFAPMFLLLTELSVKYNKAVRWLDLGITTIQPSELMKLGAIIFFAYFFSREKIKGNKKLIIGLLVVICIIFAFTKYQPDFGTALILFSVLFGMGTTLIKGVKWWLCCILLFISSLALFFLTAPDYIWERINLSYSHFTDGLSIQQQSNVGYQLTQNLEAIKGSKILGAGLGAGLKKYRVSEPITDSIFAVVAEETGFFGTSIFLSLFTFLFFCIFLISLKSREIFGKMLSLGIGLLLTMQTFLNIIVLLGVPSKGVPLLFFSKGGTSIVLAFVYIGIILNIYSKNKMKTLVK